jgi:hypothetical protein
MAAVSDDHEIYLGRVRALGIERNCAPLIFFRGGHSGNFAWRHGTCPPAAPPLTQ